MAMSYKYDWQKILTAAVVVVVVVLVWKMYTRESFASTLPYAELASAYVPVPLTQMEAAPGAYSNPGVIEAAKAPVSLPYTQLTASDVVGTVGVPIKKACTCAVKGSCGGGGSTCDMASSAGPLLAANEVDNYVKFAPY